MISSKPRDSYAKQPSRRGIQRPWPSDSKQIGRARVDTTVFYRAKHWSAQLGVKNVFDRRLYGASMHAIYIPVLPGRTFVLTTTFDLS